MAITKDEYTIRSLKKIRHKGWEIFVVSRILCLLDDEEIEFVTQQLVRRLDGTRYLTDLFFPQFALHVEVQEPAHDKTLQKDKLREQDIVDVTGHVVQEIKVGGAHKMGEIKKDVDKVVNELRRLKESQVSAGTFEPWDFETRYSPERFIDKGSIAIADNAAFRRQVDALKCFGFTGKGYQKGAWTIPDGNRDNVWFPRLYEHGNWRNELTREGQVIYERALTEEGRNSIQQQISAEKALVDKGVSRSHIVFAKAKDPLGFLLLRYVGTFKMNLAELSNEYIRFDRVRTEEKIRMSAEKKHKDL
ncbi:MAG: hypothetical protein GVY36_16310 [Verrucomicrobia bacterium]|jgi:hypothetical protein|nr:hypothetical protein [Verrucomicrobiota bacterium]